MKLRSFLFLMCFALVGSVFANKIIQHSQSANNSPRRALTSSFYPRANCGVTVINDLYYPVTISGQFDDGEYFPMYSIPPYNPFNTEESTLYIDMYYGFGCHPYTHVYMNYRDLGDVSAGRVLYTSDFLPMAAQSK